jgi:hypothetical protein
MRQRQAYREVGPTAAETLDCLSLSDKYRVLINRIDLGQGFDQINRISFVSSQSSPNRVGVNRNAQSPLLLCQQSPTSNEERLGLQAQRQIVGQDRAGRQQ